MQNPETPAQPAPPALPFPPAGSAQSLWGGFCLKGWRPEVGPAQAMLALRPWAPSLGPAKLSDMETCAHLLGHIQCLGRPREGTHLGGEHSPPFL